MLATTALGGRGPSTANGIASMSSSARRARVRPEFVWPYAGVRPDEWYTLRNKPTDEPGFGWLETRPTPTYARLEHLEVSEAPTDVTPSPREVLPPRQFEPEEPLREARLKPTAVGRYSGVLPGIWMWARELIALVRPSISASTGERRRRRLPARDFEFRDHQATLDHDPARNDGPI